MDDLVSRSSLLDKAKYDDYWFGDDYVCFAGVFVGDIENEPAVEAIPVEFLRRKLASEHTCLYGNDAEFLKNQGAYNPSAFAAGFKYALERLQGWATLLKEERR